MSGATGLRTDLSKGSGSSKIRVYVFFLTSGPGIQLNELRPCILSKHCQNDALHGRSGLLT